MWERGRVVADVSRTINAQLTELRSEQVNEKRYPRTLLTGSELRDLLQPAKTGGTDFLQFIY